MPAIHKEEWSETTPSANATGHLGEGRGQISVSNLPVESSAVSSRKQGHPANGDIITIHKQVIVKNDLVWMNRDHLAQAYPRGDVLAPERERRAADTF